MHFAGNIMSSRSVFSPLVFGLVLLGGFVVYLNWPQDDTPQKGARAATPVTAAKVEQQLFPITIEALGTAKANESMTLTAQETETVTKVLFDDGDKVTKGQLLVQLNNISEIARVNELDVNLNEARRQLQRIKNLAKTSAASEQLLDEQEATVKALEAQMAVANAQLNDLRISAPFSGRLGIRQISVGALVRPADVITTLDDTSQIKVDFTVAERHLATLAIGQQITATSNAYPGTKFIGKITAIDSRVDPVSRSILVRAVVPNTQEQLRPGMLLRIVLEKEVLQTLVIPEIALVPQEDKQFVFVIEDNKALKREVVIGERRPGIVQVISGLQQGETIVTEGTLRIKDQSPVSVLNMPTGAR